MGLFLKQEDRRSELQSKVAADLQRKLRENSSVESYEKPEPRYLENQHETNTSGLAVVLLVLAFIIVVAFVVTR